MCGSEFLNESFRELFASYMQPYMQTIIRDLERARHKPFTAEDVCNEATIAFESEKRTFGDSQDVTPMYIPFRDVQPIPESGIEWGAINIP